MTKLQKLKNIADSATQDNWYYVERMGVYSEGDIETVHNHGTRSWSNEVAKAAHAHSFDSESDNAKNMKHIATFNPSTVLKLIEVIEMQREALNKVADYPFNAHTSHLTDVTQMKRYCRYAQYDTEKLLEEIEAENERR